MRNYNRNMTHDTTTIRDLPAAMQEWARLTDVPTTLKVLQEWGGMKVSIPKRLSRRSPLVKLVGAEHARAIIAAYGDMKIDIPVLRGPSLKSRIMAFPADTPTRVVAKELMCTERFVRMVRHNAGLTMSPPARTPRNEDTIAKKILEAPSDVSDEEVAKTLDCSLGWVRHLRPDPRKAEVIAEREFLDKRILEAPLNMPATEVAAALNCPRDRVYWVRRKARAANAASAALPSHHNRF